MSEFHATMPSPCTNSRRHPFQSSLNRLAMYLSTQGVLQLERNESTFLTARARKSIGNHDPASP